jgi:hypothetical protein
VTNRMTVKWTMKADVNDHQFTVAGEGTADLSSGSTELTLRAEPGFPAGFDPALAQFMCNFTLAGYAAPTQVPVGFRDAVEAEMFVRPRRQVEITDRSGEPLVRLEALTSMSISAGQITVTNSMTGFSHLPSAVAFTTGQETLVPDGPGTATGIARYSVELVDGSTLEGMTVVPYRFDRPVLLSPAVRDLGQQDCSRTSENEVLLRASSAWFAASVTAAEIRS